MKVLITGASGQLGMELMATLSPDHQVIGMGRKEMDVTNHVGVRNAKWIRLNNRWIQLIWLMDMAHEMLQWQGKKEWAQKSFTSARTMYLMDVARSYESPKYLWAIKAGWRRNVKGFCLAIPYCS